MAKIEILDIIDEQLKKKIKKMLEDIPPKL